MADVYVHHEPCPRCRGELVFRHCEPCDAPWLHCAACQPAPACARCRAPAPHAASLEALFAADEQANAHLQGQAYRKPAPESAVDDGDAAQGLWFAYLIFAGIWPPLALELGADLRLRGWFAGPIALAFLLTGWPAWRRAWRDPVFWAQAIGAGAVATALLTGATWLGENGAEGLARPWRWGAFFTLAALWTAGYARRPAALPEWGRVLALFFKGMFAS